VTPKEERMRDVADVLNLIAEAFESAHRPGLPKIAQLYDAISNLIAAGKLQEDMKLPGEREISAAINISLGTVQRSLNLLMADGDIAREHGRGTFVRQNRRALDKLWHYRFRERGSKSLLPVYAKVISRSIVPNDDVLETKLGSSPTGYVHISRLIRIDDRFRCWSEMYLSAARFHRLLEMPLSDLESVNLKQLLNDAFGAPTVSVDQTAMVHNVSGEISRHMMVATSTPCIFLQVVAKSRRNEPITFQRIYVPPVDYELELIDGPMDLSKSLAA
jgi:GntR family transcriptional regulator